MKSWKRSIIEGVAFSLGVYAIIERLFTGSINAVNFFSDTFGYHIEANSMEISSMKGAIGLVVTWIFAGILALLKIWAVNFWHIIGSIIGMILYAGYLTSIT